MESTTKILVRRAFGEYLKQRRIGITNQDNLLEFSYTAGIDNSKLAKIEKGKVNFGFDILLQIQEAYQLSDKEILGFSTTDF